MGFNSARWHTWTQYLICTHQIIAHQQRKNKSNSLIITINYIANLKQILYISCDGFLKTSNQKELQIVSRCSEFLSLNFIFLLCTGSLLCGNAFCFACSQITLCFAKMSRKRRRNSEDEEPISIADFYRILTSLPRSGLLVWGIAQNQRL
ncbi:MAG: hypothetical protein EZS28_011848 [Streblomastix strix]|uniref:Uncharacterized protein n=1 Tax=Streblomastix strix TaxID=222440 RepID=A0A5J4WCF8_9EUKA|nr:MAG: hypothetical protein EZS28_011848 [Streblomastix strix]